jgi:hypothetical protein
MPVDADAFAVHLVIHVHFAVVDVAFGGFNTLFALSLESTKFMKLCLFFVKFSFLSISFFSFGSFSPFLRKKALLLKFCSPKLLKGFIFLGR